MQNKTENQNIGFCIVKKMQTNLEGKRHRCLDTDPSSLHWTAMSYLFTIFNLPHCRVLGKV